MELNKDKNYLKLKEKIGKAKKEYRADVTSKVMDKCYLQGYCHAYFDLELITEEQFYKLDDLI